MSANNGCNGNKLPLTPVLLNLVPMDASPFHPRSFLVLTTPTLGVVAVLSASAYAPLYDMPTQTFFASTQLSSKLLVKESGQAQVTIIRSVRLNPDREYPHVTRKFDGITVVPRLRQPKNGTRTSETPDLRFVQNSGGPDTNALWIVDLP